MCFDTAVTGHRYRLIMGMTNKILIICRKCVYREMFGNKTMKNKMKEGVLENGETKG